MLTFIVVWAVLAWFFVGVMVADIARSKGYGWGPWFTLGLLFSVFALLVIGFREPRVESGWRGSADPAS